MKLIGGIVHRGDATAKFSSLSNPTGRMVAKGNPAHAKGATGRMMDPVKMAGMWLKSGGK